MLYIAASNFKPHKLMKTRVISMLVILVALLSCEESLQVDGPKIPDTDKTVTVILSNIPAGFTGGTLYLFTLDNKGKVYAIQQAKATEGATVQVAPVPGFTTFDMAAFIPTGSDWSSKAPFTDGHYSRAVAVQDKDGVFVTKTWSTTTTLSSAPTTGLARSIQAELYVNGSANPADTDFTKGEIVTLDATVADNIKSNVTAVAYFLDATELQSYTTTPYRFQLNTADVTTGNHWLYVKASNAAGHESQDSVRIYVTDVAGNVGPSTSFSAIANGSQFERQQLVTIGANASDPDDGLDRVEFRINNTLVGTDATAPYSYLWDTYDNQVGAVVLEITAFDKSGQSRSDVVNVTLIAPENYAPRASITTPSHGASFAVGTASIELTATASDTENDAINRLEFFYRNAESATSTYIGQDATAPYAFTFNTAALPAGTYYIFARAYDNNGNSSYESVTITIQ